MSSNNQFLANSETWYPFKKKRQRRITKIAIPESRIQQSFFEEISRFPEIRPYCFAIPNGGSRHKLEAVNLKRQGVTKGVPDVFLAFPAHGYHGLFIEFKAGKNKLTPEQKEMIERLSKKGYKCEVCYSSEEAITAVEDYVTKKIIIKG